MRRITWARALVPAALLALALGVASCGGGGEGGNPDLVLVGFNVPNVAGIPLNQPLIFTFSNDVDPSSITPDTLRVVGDLGPNFETQVVDGNLIALLPRSPNFEDYSDAGLLPGIRYTVSFAIFPAPDTIRSLDGKPLLDAASYSFNTVPSPEFIEPRRPISHGLPPTEGGTSDDDGCLNNADNTLPTTKQFGSGPGARLLCLQNEGQPQVILTQCIPSHNAEAIGFPSAVTPGYVNLPGLRVRFNEPLDPLTVVPWESATKWGINVQLWLVGTTDRLPVPPRPVRTTRPFIVQSLSQTEIIIVPANEDEAGLQVGGVPQGTYVINLTGAVTDLPGNSLDTAVTLGNDPYTTGFADIANNMVGKVPAGYKIYFITLAVPGTAQSISEGFSTNLSEWGDRDSGADEPGVRERSDPPTEALRVQFVSGDTPSFTESYDVALCGQTTTANWNNGFRFLGLSSLEANTDADAGAGALKAVWKPYAGDGEDGDFLSLDAGASYGLNTDTGSVNGDGIFEYNSFHLQASDRISVTGSQPLVILCRGNFQVDGQIDVSGAAGGPGLDTDGNARYTNAGSIAAGGAGGAPGPAAATADAGRTRCPAAGRPCRARPSPLRSAWGPSGRQCRAGRACRRRRRRLRRGRPGRHGRDRRQRRRRGRAVGQPGVLARPGPLPAGSDLHRQRERIRGDRRRRRRAPRRERQRRGRERG